MTGLAEKILVYIQNKDQLSHMIISQVCSSTTLLLYLWGPVLVNALQGHNANFTLHFTLA